MKREKYICVFEFSMFFSLHIRSMWETICDAQAGFCTVDLKQ